MKKLTIGSVVCGVLVAAGLAGADQKGGAPSEADKSFLMEAAQGGRAEVEMGRVAQQRGARDDVRSFGARMIKDHSKANDELKAVAKKCGVTPPSEPSDEAKAMNERMSKLSGADFDAQYVSHMVADHEKDVAAFERESAEGSDANVKRFAAKTLPTLRDHLRQIREIDSRMKTGQGKR